MDLLANRFLAHEAQALLARLARIRPFALSETMVPAANLAPAAQRVIEAHLARGRERLRAQVADFVAALAERGDPADAQRRFALLRLRFDAVLAQLDLFADAMSQRSGRDHGVWMAGLDALAADALALPAAYESPPIVCYLDRGIGAAIRRARTRLPGGDANPAAIIRVPRERMVGSGIASSLVHEVGHQAAALLDLVGPLRAALQRRAGGDPRWRCWARWVSEIVADLWAVARLGPAATLGMIGVLGLPRPFVYRVTLDDPHPPPWLRVQIGCALGSRLYPGPAWAGLGRLWRQLYPLAAAAAGAQPLLARLAAGCDELADALLGHRVAAFDRRPLHEVASRAALQRPALQRRLAEWRRAAPAIEAWPPCTACAVVGLARCEGLLDPPAEARWLARLLTTWALGQSLGGAVRAPPAPVPAPALPTTPV